MLFFIQFKLKFLFLGRNLPLNLIGQITTPLTLKHLVEFVKSKPKRSSNTRKINPGAFSNKSPPVICKLICSISIYLSKLIKRDRRSTNIWPTITNWKLVIFSIIISFKITLTVRIIASLFKYDMKNSIAVKGISNWITG